MRILAGIAIVGCILSCNVAATVTPAVADAGNGCFERELSSVIAGARRQDIALLAKMSSTNLCPELAHSWQSGYLSGYLNYRLASLLLQTQGKTAEQLLHQAVDNLRHSIALNEHCAACHALLSGVYGLRIARRPIRGITLGPKASRHMKKARQLGTNIAIVDLLDGIGLLNTPGMFGGGLEKALVLLATAVRSMEQQQGRLGWGLADAYFWYGLALGKSGDRDAANQLFRHALQIEPEFVAAQRQLESQAGP